MTVAVLGAGAGGLCAAVELMQAGHDVRLWNRSATTLAAHVADGTIRYTGVLGSGTAQPSCVTTDITVALDGADAVVVCLPGVVHGAVFATLAGVGCTLPIVLNPGHTAGAMHAAAVFAQAGVPLPPVAELSTLTYVARVGTDGVLGATGRADQVRAAALPGGEAALTVATTLFSQAVVAPDVLATSLSDVNLVLHPPGAVLGAAWVEATGGDFTFYVEGMPPGVARVVAALDDERRAVAAAFGHDLPSLVEEMAAIGTVDAAVAATGDVAAAIRSGAANALIKAPSSYRHRYYQEDFPFGLVPFLTFARIAGVAVPVAESLLTLATAAVGTDEAGTTLLSHALTAERLGISGWTAAQLLAAVGAAGTPGAPGARTSAPAQQGATS